MPSNDSLFGGIYAIIDTIFNACKKRLILEERHMLELITTFSTLGLLVVAWWQLAKINKKTSSDFIHRLKNDFFSDQGRLIVSLIDNKCLEYHESENDHLPYFKIKINCITDIEIRNEIERKLEVLKMNKNIIDSYDMDDLILGHIEDLGMFNKYNIIDIDMIYDLFSWYIERCKENEEIGKYIDSLRAKYGQDIYEDTDYIYNKCLLEREMRKHPCKASSLFRRYCPFSK